MKIAYQASMNAFLPVEGNHGADHVDIHDHTWDQFSRSVVVAGERRDIIPCGVIPPDCLKDGIVAFDNAIRSHHQRQEDRRQERRDDRAT